jgi:hypothetical protein
VVANALPPMLCDVAGKDPAESNDVEDPFSINCSAALALSVGSVRLRIVQKYCI